MKTPSGLQRTWHALRHVPHAVSQKVASLRETKASQTKASRLASLIATHTAHQPAWTPARYDALSEVGYQKNVIVYRAVNLIARSIASVPFLLYEGDHEVDHHPLLTLLAKPNPSQGGNGFMESLISYLLLSGNAYIEATAPSPSPPQELHILRPDRMRVIPGTHGLAEGYEYQVAGNVRRVCVDPWSGQGPILHLKLFHPLNDWYGLSPLEAALKPIDLHNTVAHHNLCLLQNGGRPSGALLVKPHPKTGVPLTEAQRQHLRDSLQEIYQGTRNAGQIMILEGDFEWKEMGLSPKDMDFVEGKYVAAREIAQIFGVPPMLVGVPGDATFANYREARLHLWEDTILPLLDLVVSQLNLWLSPAFGPHLRLAYDTDAIPTLAAKREAAWEKIDGCAFLTLNEKRQAVGYAPVAGGDTLGSAPLS
jgi:HK97 family phage portal protein